MRSVNEPCERTTACEKPRRANLGENKALQSEQPHSLRLAHRALSPSRITIANGACPLKDDRKLFEFLVLDAVQAGLSWEIILRKREGFRAAFDNFDPEKIARYDSRKIQALLADAGIIRNRLKIESAISNARAFLQVQEDCGSFARYIWQFVGGAPKVNAVRSLKEIPVTSPESDAMSKALKKRGFRFVGSTICYAFMQAAGMVNDHSR